MVTEQVEQLRFNYAALDEPTRAFVQEKAQAIHARLKRTAEDIIAIGQDLREVKARLGHGQFIPWLQSEFGMSRWTAQDFMRVAERFGDKWGNFPHLSVSVLYELATPSTPKTVIQMVEEGRVAPTISAIREAKREESQREPSPEKIDFFHQWQADNIALGLDRFGDAPSVNDEVVEAHQSVDVGESPGQEGSLLIGMRANILWCTGTKRI